MDELCFDKEEHRYTLNGEEVPSVSEITRFLSRELYSDVDPLVLEAAAERGTAVHEASEQLEKDGKAELPEKYLPYLKAYLSFLKEKTPNWEAIEWQVHNGTLYAGTIDRYGMLDGKRVIVDLKTSSTIGRGHKVLYTAAQNLYRRAIEEAHPVDAIYILQLKKDATWKLIELEVQDELADACLAMHQALKKNKRRKKNDQS